MCRGGPQVRSKAKRGRLLVRMLIKSCCIYIFIYIYAPTNLVYSSTIKFIQTIQVALECGANPMLICYSWVPSEICGGWRCIQAA